MNNPLNHIATDLARQANNWPDNSHVAATLRAMSGLFAKEAARQAEPVVRCPKCFSEEVGKCSRVGGAGGDVAWMQCDDCGHQWDHS